MKLCKKCNTEKPMEGFSKHPTSADKLQAACKDCKNAYSRGYTRARTAAEQSVVVDAKVCLDCGLKKPIGQFGKKSASLDKHNEYCKACWRERCSIANKKHYTKLLRNYAKN